MKRFLLSLTAVFVASTTQAAHIYVMSSLDSTTDSATVSALTTNGHTATLGSAFSDFDGTESLGGYDAVYFVANYNWAFGDMPDTGQTALLQFVANGGGLVTAEWVGWKMAVGQFQILKDIMPITNFGAFGNSLSVTFSQDAPHPRVNHLLPSSFVLPLTSYAGTISYFTKVKAGATSFYRMTDAEDYVGLAGWPYGLGRVMSFATTNGPDQLAGQGGILLANAFDWATSHQSASPVAIVTTEGEEFGGNVSSVLGLGDDDTYSAFNSPDTLQCSVVITGNLGAVPTQLAFSAVGKVGRPGLSVGIYFYDYTALVFRFGDGQIASTSFENIPATAPGLLTRFRNGSGATTVRMTWIPVNDEDPTQDGWLHEIDFAGWTYETN